MISVSIPQKPRYVETGKNSGKFEIEGCYPGYGTTLGNALRRVLLSSLRGAAITSVKIKKVSHEFSTVPGVLEDVIQIIMNLKKVRFKLFGEGPIKVSLKSKGEGPVTAKEIKCSADIEVVNPEQIIATVTDKKAEFEMEIEVGEGLGYIPVEQQERTEKEIGVIAIDAIYTPVRRVNYVVENMRVGKKTDYEKIAMEVETDGSISPEESFQKAVEILVEQFSVLAELNTAEQAEAAKEVPAEKAAGAEAGETGAVDTEQLEVTELKVLSTRTLNILEENKIKKVKDILKMSEEKLKDLEGMGEKGIKEIKKAIGEFGLTLK